MTAAVLLVKRLAEVLVWHRSDYGDCTCSEYVLDGPYEQHLARALLPVVEQAVAEADCDARLSEMQGKADSLTGQLIKARAWDEGHRDVCSDCCCPPSRNPYRADAIATTEEAP